MRELEVAIIAVNLVVVTIAVIPMKLAPNRFVPPSAHRMHQLEGLLLAPFHRRALAFVTDLALVLVGMALLVFVCLLIARVTGLLSSPTSVTIEFNFVHWYNIVAIVIYFGLFTYYWDGQTPGKRLFRIRVVSTLHERITLWHSIERALGYAASALEAGFGFLQYFVTPNRQTVHDRIAATVVLLELSTKDSQNNLGSMPSHLPEKLALHTNSTEQAM